MSSNKSFPPSYSELAQEASERLRQVLPLVNKYKTPINPVNYAVWYEYVSGTNQALRNDLDARLHAEAPITPQVTQRLFEKHVLFDMPERLEKTNSGMKLVVDNTLVNLNHIESSASVCSAELTNNQTALESCSDVNTLKLIVDSVLASTQALTSNSNILKKDLEETSAEIKRLKAELEAIKEISRTDGLTGLLNRSAFDKELEVLCKASPERVSLALFDIDHFKTLNDNFGHLLGDKVLQFFSSIVKKHASHKHLAVRFGGEELALIMLDLSSKHAFTIAESVRLSLANSNLKQRNSEDTIGQVTTSVGISVCQADDTPHSLIERADRALYQSKAKGRNTTTLV
jgi:diguanylate cyclase